MPLGKWYAATERVEPSRVLSVSHEIRSRSRSRHRHFARHSLCARTAGLSAFRNTSSSRSTLIPARLSTAHSTFSLRNWAAIEVLAKASLLPRDVVPLGIANQRETTSRAHRRAFEHRRTPDRPLQQVRSDWNCIRMYLDGLAVNFWSSTDEIARLRGPDTIFEPASAGKDMEARQAKWRDAVKRSAGWNSRAAGNTGKSKDPLTR